MSCGENRISVDYLSLKRTRNLNKREAKAESQSQDQNSR
jgi:hypothetical protein